MSDEDTGGKLRHIARKHNVLEKTQEDSSAANDSVVDKTQDEGGGRNDTTNLSPTLKPKLKRKSSVNLVRLKTFNNALDG